MVDYAKGVASRILTDCTWNYTYDDEGNLSTKTLIAGGGGELLGIQL